jgi:hypothetical protein
LELGWGVAEWGLYGGRSCTIARTFEATVNL